MTLTTEFEAEGLEQAILKHCHSHYRKAAITQFGHGSMKYLLGFNGLTEAADQILEGTLFHNTDKECFPGVREFVAAMAIP
jgi:hypothetical protein